MMIVLKAILALVLISAILYFILKLVQKYTRIGSKLDSSEGSLQLISILYVDDNAKIVNLKRGTENYVLAISKSCMLLVDKYSNNEQELKLKNYDTKQ